MTVNKDRPAIICVTRIGISALFVEPLVLCCLNLAWTAENKFVTDINYFVRPAFCRLGDLNFSAK